MAGISVPTPKPPNILQPGEKENQLVQGYQAEGAKLQEAVAPIKQEMGRMETEIGSTNMPPLPQLQQVPQFQGRQVDSKEMLDFAGIAMILATLGTKAVKGDITLALNTAGAAMTGFNTGNLEQSRLDITQFNTKMNSVVADNNRMLSEYRAALEDRKLTISQKWQRYQMLAHKYQDEIGMAAARKGDIKFELDRLDKIRSANNNIEIKMEAMNNAWKAQMTRLELQQARQAGMNPDAGTAGLAPEAIDMLAKEAIKDKGVLANLGRGVQGARDLRAITNRMAEVLAATGGAGMAQRRQEFRADSNSLNKLTMSYDAITAFEQTALRNGKQLVDLAEKIDITGIPVAERWIRAGRKEIGGDPDVAMFHAQMTVFRTEAARILVNPNLTGQLTDSARHEVESFLSGSDSAKQIGATVKLLERDFENRKHTLEEQMDKVRDRMTKGYGAGTQPGATPQAAAKDGDKATSKSGKPMVFQGGQWMYVQ